MKAATTALVGLVSSSLVSADPRPARPFADDFEHGLARWEANGPASAIRTEPSGDAAHGRVLVLDPAGEDVYLLARGVDGSPGVRIEGDVLFPTSEENYLGVIYHFQRRGPRADFGNVYIKGNQSYLQANPHRDFNVGRLLYPEYHVDLTGDAAITVGKWQRFKVEVVGDTCHFTVGGASAPQMTFSLFEGRSGRVGLQPRSVGGPVWVDNVVITPLERLPKLAPIPAFAYAPASLVTSWEVIGPLAAVDDDIGRRPAARKWRPFATDARGAVITARVTDYRGPRAVAYLRTRIQSPGRRKAKLRFSTVDPLLIWVNGHFRRFVRPGEAAWYDVATNPAHPAAEVPIDLVPGSNEVVVRVRGGVNAAGGFFVALVD